MPRNDPTENGGLFIGRRPGTAPLKYRTEPVRRGDRRQRIDGSFAHAVLAVEALVVLTAWGPQPVAWLWVGSQVDYLTGSVSVGIATVFAGLMATLLATLAFASRIDHGWRILRRAAGHDQIEGALSRIFMWTAIFAGSAFLFWFFIVAGPGPSLAPGS